MRRLCAILIGLGLSVSPVSAQVIDSGFINAGTACTTTGACVSATLGEATSVTIQIVGTFSATLSFEGTADGTTWVAVQVANLADGTVSTSTTAAGAFSLSNVGVQRVRVRASSYASGGAQVSIVRGYGSVRWTGFSSVTVNPGPITVTSNALGTTSFRGFILQNTTAAAAGAQQYSPMACQSGFGWKTDATAGSQKVEFCTEVQPVQGTSAPSGNFLIKASINGGAFSTVGTLTSAGAFTAPGNITGARMIGTGFENNQSQQYWWTGRSTLQSTADGNVRFGNNTVSNTYDVTLADWGTTLSAEGVSYTDTLVVSGPASGVGTLTLSIGTDNNVCVFALTGTSAPVELDDPGTFCSITADTASSVNVYYSSGYKIQNLRGGARTIRAVFIGG